MIRDRNLLAQLPHIYTFSIGLFVHTCTSATGENFAKCWTKYRCRRMLEMIENTHTPDV
jgi:hypothetical protein